MFLQGFCFYNGHKDPDPLFLFPESKEGFILLLEINRTLFFARIFVIW